MKLNEEQVEAFMQSLYDNGDKELKKLFKHQYEIKGAILQEIANIMLIYVIENDVMKMSSIEKLKEMENLIKIINSYVKADAELQIKIISNLLANTVNDAFEFYSYNAKKKETEKIIKQNYKGKHFSKRVWDNEEEVAKYLHKQTQDFLQGKTSVNKIKKEIESTFNTSAYNAKRLVETEISRCSNSAFDRFCIETDVKTLKYNSILDNKLCDDCKQYNGKIFTYKGKIEIPRHPLCRCYYEIVEYEGI